VLDKEHKNLRLHAQLLHVRSMKNKVVHCGHLIGFFTKAPLTESVREYKYLRYVFISLKMGKVERKTFPPISRSKITKTTKKMLKNTLYLHLSAGSRPIYQCKI
jgi:hypothetical protein